MSEDKAKVDHDYPPFSRVFVVCSRSHTEEDLTDAFGKHGQVEDIWLVKDKVTKENKGVAYVKFAKASEAAVAIEMLNGVTISGNSKPIKALLADSKDSTRTDTATNLALTEDRHRTRLFILCSKTSTESDLSEDFSKFGLVSHVQLLKDRATGAHKGCAYVRFSKPSEAFTALENCDDSYKAVMAEPRLPKNTITSVREGGQPPQALYSRVDCPVPQGFPTHTEPGATNKLTITCHTALTEQQLTRLCDVCPGLVHVQLAANRHGESRGMATAEYSNPAAASYARGKLANIEYPPGFRLEISYNNYKQEHMGYQGNMDHSGGYNYYDNSGMQGGNMSGGYDYNFGYQGNPNNSTMALNNSSCQYTDVALPDVQPLSTSTKHRAKLFFVSAPQSVSEDILIDVFCRFSNLISIQLIPGTAYGYIKYSVKESADAAKMLLDGAIVAGNTLRISVAEESDSKRAKVSD